MTKTFYLSLGASIIALVALVVGTASPAAAQRVEAGRRQFDGNWTVNNSSATCMVKRATWTLTVRNGMVGGGGNFPATGSISAIGVAKWTRPAKADGKRVSYTGSFRGNAGSGTYSSAGGGCSGRFTARRS